MGNPIASTFGVWLTIIWLQALLQGCGMLQVWLYFHWYKKDHWGIKAMVIALLLLETFQIVTFFVATYFYLINGFGDSLGLLIIHWQDSAQIFATFLSAFIVQIYFGYCIYVLDKTRIIIPAIIVILALTQIGSGVAQTVLTLRISSFKDLSSTKPVSTLQAAAALLCDIVITAALVVTLANRKGTIKTTNNILTTLMINAVNRGLLTAICALLNLVLFIVFPDTFYFFIGVELSGKLYMNSALATLNSRQHTIKRSRVPVTTGDSSTRDWNSIPMGAISTGTGYTGTLQDPEHESHVHVLVSKQTIADNDPEEYKDTPNFVDGMV